MRFDVSYTTILEMCYHIAKKRVEHKKANKEEYSIYQVREYSIGQIKLKLQEMELRYNTIGNVTKNIDDARDLVHYGLFLLEAYKAEERIETGIETELQE